jgi:hypothetical protein
MKKVSFGAKRPTVVTPAGEIDHWVENQTGDEPTKRFTVDVPVSLHRRVKCRCAMENHIMADVIRQILEKRFPPEGEGGGAS